MTNQFNNIGNQLRAFHNSNGRINASNKGKMTEIMNPDQAQDLVKFLLLKNNSDILRNISMQSYAHGLGQDKILIHRATPKTGNTELRYHLWPEKGEIDIEGRHHHNWEGYSLVLDGVQEEHHFEKTIANKEESMIYNKFISFLEQKNLSSENIRKIITDLDILEISKEYPESRVFTEFNTSIPSEEHLSQAIGLNKKELKTILPLHIVYGNHMDLSTGIESFRKEEGIQSLQFSDARKIKTGESYYLPEGTPHRVLADGTSTFIATNVNPDPKAPRWSGYKIESLISQNTDKERVFFTEKELRGKLEKILSYF